MLAYLQMIRFELSVLGGLSGVFRIRRVAATNWERARERDRDRPIKEDETRCFAKQASESTVAMSPRLMRMATDSSVGNREEPDTMPTHQQAASSKNP